MVLKIKISEKKSYSYIFIITLALIFISYKSTSQTIKIATDEWCPYDCLPDQNNGKVGYMASILEYAFNKRGLNVEFIEVPYPRGLDLVRQGLLDATVAAYKEDAPDFIFSEHQQGISNSTFFVKKNSTWRYEGVKSLKKAKLIGVIKGYDYVDKTVMNYIHSNPENILQITGQQPLERLINMLIAGRITSIIEDKSVLQYKANQLGLLDVIQVAGNTPVKIGVYSGFSPVKDKSKDYAKILDEELVKMRKSGELKQILDFHNLIDWLKVTPTE